MREKLIEEIKSILSIEDPEAGDPNEYKNLKSDAKGPSNLSKFKLDEEDEFSAEYPFCV